MVEGIQVVKLALITTCINPKLKVCFKELSEGTIKADPVFHLAHTVAFIGMAKVLPKGEYMLSLENGERIKVSRNYRSEISDFLGRLDPE